MSNNNIEQFKNLVQGLACTKGFIVLNGILEESNESPTTSRGIEVMNAWCRCGREAEDEIVDEFDKVLLERLYTLGLEDRSHEIRIECENPWDPA